MKTLNKITIVFIASLLCYSLNAQIVPAPGTTTTCDQSTVSTGDLFADPGGLGGDCGGDGFVVAPGDYPNCGCASTKTICADAGETVTLDFTEMGLFTPFDYIVVYDGPNSGSPVVYDANTNGDDTLAEFIASNGGSTITSSSECLTLEFNASTVVDNCGFIAEISFSETLSVPAMGEWGLIILGLLFVAFGMVFVFKKKLRPEAGKI